MTPASKFWIVTGLKGCRHNSIALAEAEAKQMAHINAAQGTEFHVMESVAAYRGTVTVSRVDAEPEVKAEEVKPERVREHKKAIPDCWPDDLLHTATGSESWATGKAPYVPQVGDVVRDNDDGMIGLVGRIKPSLVVRCLDGSNGYPSSLDRFTLLYRPSADSEGEGTTK